MRVLITGGAGFLGSHIADRLAEEGVPVRILDDMSTGRRENVADKSMLMTGDVRHRIREAWEFQPTVVVHAAASYRDPQAWEQDTKTNVLGALAVLTQNPPPERIVYFQTSLCYGIAAPRLPLPETWAIDPRGSYAVTKTAGEQFIRDSGIDYVSFRLANIYGPRNRSGPIPAFYKRIREGLPCVAAKSRRDYVFVHDAVDVFVKAIHGEGRPGVYHVATGHDYEIAAIANLVGIAMGENPDVEEVDRGPDDAPSILLDPRKTEREFGWTATTRLDLGIAETVAWYDQNEVGDVYTHLRMKEAG